MFATPTPAASLDTVNGWRSRVGEPIRETFLHGLRPDIVHVASLFEGLVDDAVASVGTIRSSHATATTLYDLIPLASGEGLPTAASVDWYQRKLASLKRSDLLLALSDHARAQAVAQLPMQAERVVVVSTAASEVFRPGALPPDAVSALCARHGITRPFVLHAGGFDARKNVANLIAAYARLPLRPSLGIPARSRRRRRSRRARAPSRTVRARGTEPGGRAVSGTVAGRGSRRALRPLRGVVPPVVPGRLRTARAGSDGVRRRRRGGRRDEHSRGHWTKRCALRSCGRRRGGGKDSCRADRSRVSSRPAGARPAPIRAVHLARDGAPRIGRHGGVRSSAGAARPSIAAPTRAGFRSNVPRLRTCRPCRPSERESPRTAASCCLIWHATTTSSSSRGKRPWNCRATWRRGRSDRSSGSKRMPNRCQRVLYQLGNSPAHQWMFDLLERLPGTVVLHDFFLGGVLNWMDESWLAPGTFRARLFESHGYSALIADSALGRAAAIDRYPCNSRVVEHANGIIVHSDEALRMATTWHGDVGDQWRRIPQPRRLEPVTDREAARRALQIDDGDFVVCCFGFIDPAKLDHRLLSCVAGLDARARAAPPPRLRRPEPWRRVRAIDVAVDRGRPCRPAYPDHRLRRRRHLSSATCAPPMPPFSSAGCRAENRREPRSIAWHTDCL